MEINVMAVCLAMADKGYSTSELAKRAKLRDRQLKSIPARAAKERQRCFTGLVKPSSLVLVR